MQLVAHRCAHYYSLVLETGQEVSPLSLSCGFTFFSSPFLTDFGVPGWPVAEFRVFVTWGTLFGFFELFPLAIIRCLLVWVEWVSLILGVFAGRLKVGVASCYYLFTLIDACHYPRWNKCEGADREHTVGGCILDTIDRWMQSSGC